MKSFPPTNLGEARRIRSGSDLRTFTVCSLPFGVFIDTHGEAEPNFDFFGLAFLAPNTHSRESLATTLGQFLASVSCVSPGFSSCRELRASLTGRCQTFAPRAAPLSPRQSLSSFASSFRGKRLSQSRARRKTHVRWPHLGAEASSALSRRLAL